MSLEDLFLIHREVVASTEKRIKRYLYQLINWDSHAICIFGDRGVGKTTLMCQHLQEYQTHDRALYISADHIYVNAQGLFPIAQQFFSNGGEALYIDEIHKYPNWSVELKNIIDTYKRCKIVFSASSSLDLNQSKGDLSRRVVYRQMLGLSFREFLTFQLNKSFPVLSLDEIIQDHVKLTHQFSSIRILKFFKDYLMHGYYPFYLESIEEYFEKLNNVIEKVIFEDIAVIFNLKQTTLPVLKKLLWLVASTEGLTPNIDNISSSIGISREVIYNCIEYLGRSGLITNLYPAGKGLKLVRKPGKIFMNNSNLLHAVNRSLKRGSDSGAVRETFFANQVAALHKINIHSAADFLVDDRLLFEVGGKNKMERQIKDETDAFLALDEIETGYKNRIPLYLFGFLY